jgi:ectoine hydroxylase-related dioxygenase (phytanoyl-CoA dioxygenase family)
LQLALDWSKAIEKEGFYLLQRAIESAVVSRLLNRCAEAFAKDQNAQNARSSQGHIYAARNVIDFVPEVKTLWRESALTELLIEVLGENFGLVRALFFDKPPDRTWSLPWHKDATIAVADNSLPSMHFSRPTNKAGVPHVVASDDILRQMLTFRVHLDDVDDDNGPLKMIPRSHLSRDCRGLGPDQAVTIHAKAGDVLAMRPLIDHSSGSSKPGVTRHRRILHLEFAATPNLPDGYAWHQFIGWNTVANER